MHSTEAQRLLPAWEKLDQIQRSPDQRVQKRQKKIVLIPSTSFTATFTAIFFRNTERWEYEITVHILKL